MSRYAVVPDNCAPPASVWLWGQASGDRGEGRTAIRMSAGRGRDTELLGVGFGWIAGGWKRWGVRILGG